MFRQRKKKNINEFYTARETGANPISSITNNYRYAAQQDFSQTKYLTKVMNRASSNAEITLTKEKYRILAGKLHVYIQQGDRYEPVEHNNYVDLSRLVQRIRADNEKKRLKTSNTQLWAPSEEPAVKVNLCSRETQRQMRSSELISLRSSCMSKTSKRSLTGQNFYVTQNSSYKTPSEILSERCLTSSYQLSR